MSFFKRLFSIGEAHANSALDSMEDPVKMTEQGIRDLEKDLRASMEGLAEVKAINIRTRKELEARKAEGKDYEQKAMLLLQKAQGGQLAVEEADRLASQALEKKTQADQAVATQEKMLQQTQSQEQKMDANVRRLKQEIDKYKNELKTLKARAKVSESTAKLNKTLANVDSTSTVSMLERMKEKVDKQEALAESYGEMADVNKSVDDEISAALGSSTSSESLLALKAKMGMLPKGDEGTGDSNTAS